MSWDAGSCLKYGGSAVADLEWTSITSKGDCETLCEADSTCTGASYDSSADVCSGHTEALSHGDGSSGLECGVVDHLWQMSWGSGNCLSSSGSAAAVAYTWTAVGSKGDCETLCSGQPDCTGASYDSGTDICSAHTEALSNGDGSSTGDCGVVAYQWTISWDSGWCVVNNGAATVAYTWSTVTSKGDCEDLCMADTSCQGAWYDSSTDVCSAYTEDLSFGDD
eukprot:scaffold472099_cov26-Prasinocladus_malaysianus.AAC.1